VSWGSNGHLLPRELTVRAQSVKTGFAMNSAPPLTSTLSEALCNTLQLEARDWIQMENTKTALVNQPGSRPVHEDE
jgi:hypothetical protein